MTYIKYGNIVQYSVTHLKIVSEDDFWIKIEQGLSTITRKLTTLFVIKTFCFFFKFCQMT